MLSDNRLSQIMQRLLSWHFCRAKKNKIRFCALSFDFMKIIICVLRQALNLRYAQGTYGTRGTQGHTAHTEHTHVHAVGNQHCP